MNNNEPTALYEDCLDGEKAQIANMDEIDYLTLLMKAGSSRHHKSENLHIDLF